MPNVAIIEPKANQNALRVILAMRIPKHAVAELATIHDTAGSRKSALCSD